MCLFHIELMVFVDDVADLEKCRPMSSGVGLWSRPPGRTDPGPAGRCARGVWGRFQASRR